MVTLDKGTPNQVLAAIFIRNVLADFIRMVNTAANVEEYREAVNTARSHLAAFDAIMGDELRVIENMSKMQLPFDVRLSS